MVRHVIALVSALSLTSVFGVGCAEPVEEPEEQESISSNIIGGGIDQGHPAVALLVWQSKFPDGSPAISNCTGTLVAPTVVLTAAHCVGPENFNGRVFFGTEGGKAMGRNGGTAQPEKFIRITSQTAHPEYRDPENREPDVAIVTLERAPEGITPMPIFRGTINPSAVGVVGTAVGFGNTQAGVAGDMTKRMVPVRLDAFNAVSIEFGAKGQSTCQGDSGGPQFFNVNGKETIVTVTSRGKIVGCGDVSIGARPGAFLDFIDPFLKGAGAAPAPKPSTPAAPAAGSRTLAAGKTDTFTKTGTKARVTFDASGDAFVTVRYGNSQSSSNGGVSQMNAGKPTTFTFEVRSPSGTVQNYSLNVEMD